MDKYPFLDIQEKTDLEIHLRDCKDCQVKYAQIKRKVDLLNKYQVTKNQDFWSAFNQEFWEKIREQRAPLHQWRLRPIFQSLTMLLLAGLIILTIDYFRPSQEPQESILYYSYDDSEIEESFIDYVAMNEDNSPLLMLFREYLDDLIIGEQIIEEAIPLETELYLIGDQDAKILLNRLKEYETSIAKDSPIYKYLYSKSG
ncbi:hypothetical protein JW877_02865 [bacterium]|nr:hypothetical protein [bacterium]